MKEIRFDDLEALAQLVSDDFGDFGESIEVSQQMIDGFAKLTGDKQWIHVDVERASREGGFGGTIAHGFLVLSLLTQLTASIPSRATIVGHSSVINYGADKLRFISPVPAGSRIHARRRIAHVRKKGPQGAQITSDNEIWLVGGGPRPAVSYLSLALFMA